MRQSLVVLCLAACTQPLAAQAAPDTFRLHELVVTATKVAAPRAAVPAHVTILRGVEMRARGHTRVVDALRDAAGVSVAQLGAPGAVASLFMRGGESDYVQVLVDGVQVNDPGGAFDWAHLSTADVDRIEIVRGPASVLYGSDAVSGVVQIFTRRGAGAPRVQAQLGMGTGERVGAQADGRYATWSGSASVAGGLAVAPGVATSYSVSGARQQSDGAYAFNNEYDNRTAAARLGIAARGGTTLALTGRYTDQRFHYPTDGAGNVLDRNRATFGESWAAGLSLAQPFASRFTASLAAGTYRNDTGAEDPADEAGQSASRSDARVRRDQLELRVDAAAARTLTVSLGGELERQHGATHFESDGPWAYEARSDDRRSSRAAFAQLVRAGERLGFTAGARLDDSDQFGSFATARAGVSYRLLPMLRAHAAYGSGFKEPTFLETYATGFARGNPALEPEQSRSGELGLRFDAARGHVAVTSFAQRFRNLIQYTFTAPSEDAPNYYNIGAAEARGAELEAGATHGALTARAAYAYVHTRVTDAGFGEDMQFAAGERLLRRPTHGGSTGLDWRLHPALTAALQANYTGTRADLDFTDPDVWQGKPVELEPHTTIDAALRIAPRVRWGAFETTLRVRNLLDERYHEVYNFPAPGRVVSIGVSVER